MMRRHDMITLGLWPLMTRVQNEGVRRIGMLLAGIFRRFRLAGALRGAGP